MNGVQTRFKCKLDVKRCKRFVFPPSSLLPRSNALKTKAIRYFQTDRTLTRIVSPPLHAFVHYPANTYPGQDRPLADNTHFNPYGAYQIAKCVIEGMKKAGLPVVKFLRADYQGYNPSQPDNRDSFKWNDIPFTEVEKPDGN